MNGSHREGPVEPMFIEEEVKERAAPEPHEYRQQHEPEPVLSLDQVCQNGVWTRWVPERCTEDQMASYNELRRMLDSSGYDWVSQNFALRYVKSYNWDPKGAFERIKACHEWRSEHNLYGDFDTADIAESKALNGIASQGNDKQGRALAWCRVRHYQTSLMTDFQAQKYGTWAIDQAVCKEMKPWCDSYVMIVDFEGSGWGNFSLSQLQALSPILSNVYAERLHKMLIIRSGFSMSMMYKAISPFIHEVTK